MMLSLPKSTVCEWNGASQLLCNHALHQVISISAYIHQQHFKKSGSPYCVTTWTFALLTVWVNTALPLNSVLKRGVERTQEAVSAQCVIRMWSIAGVIDCVCTGLLLLENTSQHLYVSLWKHDVGTSRPLDNLVFNLSLIDALQPGTCRCLTLLWIDWLWTLIKQETLIG